MNNLVLSDTKQKLVIRIVGDFSRAKIDVAGNWSIKTRLQLTCSCKREDSGIRPAL